MTTDYSNDFKMQKQPLFKLKINKKVKLIEKKSVHEYLRHKRYKSIYDTSITGIQYWHNNIKQSAQQYL